MYVANRVRETSTTTGTGTITLAGAVAQHKTFASRVPTGGQCEYCILDANGTGWEVGIGTMASSTTLARTKIMESTNSDAAVSLSAGTHTVFLTMSAASGGGMKLYMKRHGGCIADGTTDDSTKINNVLAQAAVTKEEVVFEPGVYLHPNGVVDTSTELVVSGMGHISPGPGEQWVGQGSVILTTAAGKWCWTREGTDTTDIEYRGCRISNMGFRGDADTAGGLLLRTGNNVAENITAMRHTTGKGICLLGASADTTAAAAALSKLYNCTTIDCLTGLQVGDATDNPAIYAYVYNSINLKFSSGGIQFTGTGIVSYDTETSFFGGHNESHATGFLSAGIGKGPMVIGMHFENNTNWDFDLSRASGSSATRNILLCQTSKIRIGADQNFDMVLGGDSQYSSMTISGVNTMMLSHGIGQAMIGHSVASGAPTIGGDGSITIKDGKLYYKTAGAWKALTGT